MQKCLTILCFITLHSICCTAQLSIVADVCHPIADSTLPNAPLLAIRSINIAGNKQTKIYIVERELTLKKGTLYTPKKLKENIVLSRQQLINTSLFVDVEILSFETENGQVDIYINAKERFYLIPLPYFKVVDRNWNEWIKTYGASLTHVNLGLKLSQNNVSGRNDNLNLNLVTGYTQQVAINYRAPFLDKKLQHGISAGIDYGRNREINYATNADTILNLKLDKFIRKSFNAELGYSYRKGSRQRHFVKLLYHAESIDSAVLKVNENFFGNNQLRTHFIDLTYNFQYYNVDYRPYPLEGWYVDVYATKRFSKSLGSIGIGGKYLQSWKVLPSAYFSIQAAGLIRLPFTQPNYNTHLLGYGDLNLRGQEYYVVDGVAAGILKATIKKKLVSFNIKNLFKNKTYSNIPFCIYAKAYADAGYVYNKYPNNSRLSNKYLHTAGFGIDIVTIYDLAIKLEFSFNQLGGGGLFVHSSSDF